MSEVLDSWNPDAYVRNAHFVSDLGQGVVELLHPHAGECVLDLGCGDGTLALAIAQTGADVIGIDSSPAFIAAARARGVDAHVMDAEHLTFRAKFDAVFSNAALHWMRDADAVLAGVRRALKPEGRFVGEFGGHGNVASIRTALIAVLKGRGVDGVALSPWYFPTAEEYRVKLEAHAFEVEMIQSIPRPTPLPTDMRGWLETFAGAFLVEVEEAERSAILDEVTSLLAPSLRSEASRWTADYVRLRFSATTRLCEE